MWRYPKILAHRGGGKLAPENTMAGLRAGLRYGFRAVEFDVMLSRDGVPLLMHDPEFGRTIAGNGAVADTLAADLVQMDAGSWFGPEFAGARAPLFAEVLEFCRQEQIFMNVEIKPAPGHETRTGQIVAAMVRDFCAAHPDLPPPLLSSFSMEAMQAAASAAPDVARGLLFERVPADWRARMQAHGAIALHTHYSQASAALAQEAHAAGWALFCYTVNTLELAAHLRMLGVDAFCTDRIDVLGPHVWD
ncbi:glycerophosphodiester phosphodiesterase [Massilia sp. W12]|uniref:glycerophosphodiester phosphodiesterase n=1 Tax=Massilia sp. W12 TaxID=3126507 RepID=UPI0030D5DAD7